MLKFTSYREKISKKNICIKFTDLVKCKLIYGLLKHTLLIFIKKCLFFRTDLISSQIHL